MNKCRKCGHTWIQRTEKKPKQCPRCKSYDWEKKPIPKQNKKRQGNSIQNKAN